MDDRFAAYGDLWAAVLGDNGAEAQVGAVPGEYCPGAYRVNARGQVKLVGTAQRLVRRAWLFSAVAIFDDADVIAPLLTEICGHLQLPSWPRRPRLVPLRPRCRASSDIRAFRDCRGCPS